MKMKWRIGLATGALALALQTPASAQLKVQVEPNNHPQSPPAANQNPAQPAQAPGIDVHANKVAGNVDTSQVRATSLIGMSLQDQNGQDLGKISDIVLDLNNQSIQYLLVSNQSQADSYFAVPPTVLNTQYNESANGPTVTTTVPAAQFRQAPVFTQQQWTVRGVDPTWAQRNSTYYQQYSTRPSTERRLERQEQRIENRLNR
ncbi:PRC-barrel domain-containing protein [Planctomicrobium piriforme]|uniref:PRC-barrel domain-containing protein n=1 Tax=Planctomicrobium piriforme TaxID=1576369 RepID=A0A1I3RA24_9PLAN|nr:PRC-barrel domain-containing protein [Planctomicrobium piriforme]SFJ42519.1 PRC-barrel domain-containing protein [Planctomicrobium piriforme]